MVAPVMKEMIRAVHEFSKRTGITVEDFSIRKEDNYQGEGIRCYLNGRYEENPPPSSFPDGMTLYTVHYTQKEVDKVVEEFENEERD